MIFIIIYILFKYYLYKKEIKPIIIVDLTPLQRKIVDIWVSTILNSNGARGGNRTRTASRLTDFESVAYT